MQVSSNNSWISLAMTSSPGVAPGETTTGSGNLGSNDGARNAVGLFHVVVVSGVLQKTRKSDEGRPRGAPRPSTGALCIFQGGRTSRKSAAVMPRSCAARTLVAFVLFAGVESRIGHLLFTAVFATSVVLLLILLKMLDYPFEGALTLSNADFVKTIERVSTTMGGV